MSSDKHKEAIVRMHALTGMLSASPTDCFHQFSTEQHVLQSWDTNSAKARKEKEFRRTLCVGSLTCCCVVGGQREDVAGLAELRADSSGKLWAKVDKDIGAAAYTLTDAEWDTKA